MQSRTSERARMDYRAALQQVVHIRDHNIDRNMLLQGDTLIVAKSSLNRWGLSVSSFNLEQKNRVCKIVFVEYLRGNETRVSLCNAIATYEMGLDNFLQKFPNCNEVIFQGHLPCMNECNIVKNRNAKLKIIDYGNELTNAQILEMEMTNPGYIVFEPGAREIPRSFYTRILPTEQANVSISPLSIFYRSRMRVDFAAEDIISDVISVDSGVINQHIITSNLSNEVQTNTESFAPSNFHEDRSEAELEGYKPHLRRYVESFEGTEKLSAQIAALELTKEEKQELEDNNFTDPFTYEVMNIPVYLHEKYYDLDTLTALIKDKSELDRSGHRIYYKEVPQGRYELHDIQAASTLKLTPMKEFIQRVKNRIALEEERERELMSSEDNNCARISP